MPVRSLTIHPRVSGSHGRAQVSAGIWPPVVGIADCSNDRPRLILLSDCASDAERKVLQMDKPSVTTRFEEYLSESDLRDASIDMKRRALKYWLLLHGDTPMETVTPSMAMAYRSYLHQDRQESSVNGYLNNFKGFFSWAWKNGRIASNPFAAVQPYKVDRMPRETFTADELTRLLAVAEGVWRIRLCLHLMGGRKGAVLNLTRDECHLDSPQPHVLIAKKGKTTQTWPWKVKSHGLRWIAVPPVLRFAGGQEVCFLEEFKEYLAKLPRDQVYVCLPPKYIDKMLRWQRENKLTWSRR